jgi:hypothetical protein
MKWSNDDSKTYVLRLTNGGGESGIENQYIMKMLTERLTWFGPFITELSTIRGKVMLHYPELLEKGVKAKGKDYYNLDGEVISYLLTNMENQILQCMVTACMKKKVKIASLIYDGFMVYKDCVPDINAFCLYLEQEVKEHTKHVVSIVEKEMKEGLIIPDDYKDSSQRSLEEKEKKKQELLLEKKRKEQEKVQMKELEKEYKAQQKQLQKEAKEQDDKETDRELADLFLEEFKDKIKYDKNIGRGYFYDEKTRLWVEFTNFEALYEPIMIRCSLEHTKEVRNVGNMVKFKLMNRMDDLTLFNMVAGVISVQDGMVYDMKQGKERVRVKEDYCSFFINHRYSEAYDKQWVTNYIGELIGHSQSLIEQFLELVGYSLSAENVLKLVIILLGEGDNGKSLLIEMIQSCMEAYQTVASSKIIKKPKFESNTHEAHLFALLNKRAAFSTELNGTDEFNCQV